MEPLHLLLENEIDTAMLGLLIGKYSRPGDLVYLEGELGAGKTTITKSIAQSIGVPAESVTSPTFTLVHEYLGGRLRLVHLDLYRLRHADELEQLGFEDYVSAEDGLVVIEWARNARERLPEDAVSLGLTFVKDHLERRQAALFAGGERSLKLLTSVAKEFRCSF